MSDHHADLNGQIISLFGGGGFLGRHAAQALMQRGARVRIIQRQPRRAFDIRALGNLGQVQFVAADAGNADHVARAMAGSGAVINLIGILKGDFDSAHHRVATNIANAAAAQGIRHMVQVSAIGADADSASAYGRSKAMGETAVMSALPGATILRPSVVFGRQDQFINRFAAMIRMAPIVPVVAGNTRFQPVFVGDVADAIAGSIADPTRHGGQTYELGGPQTVTMRALLAWIADQIARKPLLVDVPDFAAAALATATGWLPGAPITRDQWAMLQRDNVVTGKDGLAAIGIVGTPMDAVADGWLTMYRRHGRFAGKVTA
ncbi:MAG: complex I NDUFA9 subunit family protein [Sphingopyxis sp.]|jgi:NADH dehydrogenase|nr:complex I NDUFA9 subunit family protein [Sphingopyxis sp.]